jgi:hypothetical protein
MGGNSKWVILFKPGEMGIEKMEIPDFFFFVF